MRQDARRSAGGRPLVRLSHQTIVTETVQTPPKKGTEEGEVLRAPRRPTSRGSQAGRIGHATHRPGGSAWKDRISVVEHADLLKSGSSISRDVRARGTRELKARGLLHVASMAVARAPGASILDGPGKDLLAGRSSRPAFSVRLDLAIIR